MTSRNAGRWRRRATIITSTTTSSSSRSIPAPIRAETMRKMQATLRCRALPKITPRQRRSSKTSANDRQRKGGIRRTVRLAHRHAPQVHTDSGQARRGFRHRKLRGRRLEQLMAEEDVTSFWADTITSTPAASFSTETATLSANVSTRSMMPTA